MFTQNCQDNTYPHTKRGLHLKNIQAGDVLVTSLCPLLPSAGEKTEFQMEELRRITNVGAKTPVYILCLTELKRLTHAGGTKNASVYKLNTHN